MHGIDPDNKYKIREGWFAGVTHSLEGAIQRGMVRDDNLKKRIEEFIARVQDKIPQDDDPASLRTTADIQFANAVIDEVLSLTGYADTPLDLSDLNR